jgi:hypothetical protein
VVLLEIETKVRKLFAVKGYNLISQQLVKWVVADMVKGYQITYRP